MVRTYRHWSLLAALCTGFLTAGCASPASSGAGDREDVAEGRSALTAGCVTIKRGAAGNVFDTHLSPGNGNWAAGSSTGTWTGGNNRSAFKFDLSPVPANANVISSTFSVDVSWNSNASAVEAHEINKDWNEATATNSTLGGNGSYEAPVLGSFNPIWGSNGHRTISITDLTKAWLAGTKANNGIMLVQPSGNNHYFYTSEAVDATIRPTLTVCWDGEINVDDCAPSPCLNGGTCTDGANTYTCTCPAGYAGTNCEINVDDCAPSPCLNGGTCVDGVNSYACTCAGGYTGTNCELPPPPLETCSDSIQNQDETGIDCGGATCAPCGGGGGGNRTISAGTDFTCATFPAGNAECWGYGGYGQLGNGDYAYAYLPVAVSGITSATGIATGYLMACAALASGEVNCWGYGGYGQLGNGATDDSSLPVPVTGISNAVAVETGWSYHSCALLATAEVRCWGYGADGELGNGATNDSSTPVAVSGITNAVRVAVGEYSGYALLADGGVRSWGYNGYGQLGDGSYNDSATPVAVSGITSAVDLDAFGDYACAVLASGQITCWGSGSYGQLGDGLGGDSAVPVMVSDIGSAVSVAAGLYHTCALLSDGTVKCWGDNAYGQLGNGTTDSALTPVLVSGLGPVVSISAGAHHTCALLADGSAKCWGDNSSGQLGDGIGADSSVPVTVLGLDGAGIDECLNSPCGPGTCTDTSDGYTCACAPNSITLGSPTAPSCQCLPGFTGATCDDINECANGAPCGAGTCTNTPGSYTCTCPAGLTGANCENADCNVAIPDVVSNLTHRWTFDEASGATVVDAAGSANGTMGASSSRAIGPNGTGIVQLTPANECDETANVDFGTAPAALGTQSFTISHWIMTTYNVAGTHGDIIGNRQDGSGGNFLGVRMLGSGAVSEEVYEDPFGTNAAGVGTPAGMINNGAWHHVAYTRAGSTLKLYVDGVLMGSSSSTAPANLLGATPLRIGRSLPGFCGGNFKSLPLSFEDVRVYSRALNKCDVAALVAQNGN